MNPRTSRGWGQDLHSVFVLGFFWKRKDGRKRESMNKGRSETDGEGGGRVRCAALSQIQLMPLRGVDQVMTWGLLD